MMDPLLEKHAIEECAKNADNKALKIREERYDKLFENWKRARLAIEREIPFKDRITYYQKMNALEYDLKEERREKK